MSKERKRNVPYYVCVNFWIYNVLGVFVLPFAQSSVMKKFVHNFSTSSRISFGYVRNPCKGLRP